MKWGMWSAKERFDKTSIAVLYLPSRNALLTGLCENFKSPKYCRQESFIILQSRPPFQFRHLRKLCDILTVLKFAYRKIKIMKFKKERSLLLFFLCFMVLFFYWLRDKIFISKYLISIFCTSIQWQSHAYENGKCMIHLTTDKWV